MQSTRHRPEGSAPENGHAFPCSAVQRRYWVLHELDPRNSMPNLVLRWRLDGKLSHANLERAFRALVARHDILRTSFAHRGDEPVQFVAAQVSAMIPAIDLTTLAESDAWAEAERIAQLDAAIPFDISTAPLIRITQLRLRDNVSLLLVTAHRLVCDEGSSTILARELGQICAALQAEQTPVLAPLPVRYAELATRQIAQWTEERAQPEVEYWTRTLEGVKHFEVQPDRPRPSLQTTNVGSHSVLLDAQLTADLAQMSERHGCTLLVTAVAGLFALLHRYTGETDLTIGSQFSDRDEPGLDLTNLVGPLTNALVLRHDLSDDPSFSVLLARLRIVINGALQHRHIPLDRLIEIINPARDWSHHTLSVNFHFQESIIGEQQFGNLRLAEQTPYPGGAMYDLNFIVLPYAQGWRVGCEFSRDLFEDQTIARLLQHFARLLSAAVADPDKRISRLEFIDAVEEQMLAVDNNRTAADYPAHLTVTQLFTQQVESTPEAIAVVCGEHRLTYRELDSASNRLARLLLERGLAPATRIGVFLDRSPDLMVALLGILKSGSAYIPLDPVYPRERLKHVFDSSQPAAVITRLALRERLDLGETTAIVLDAEPALTGSEDGAGVTHRAAPGDPAYLIYTSGSTGKPKGVQIPHRALVNLLWAMRSQPGIEITDTVVSVTTISFDLVVPDLFLPLIVGAKLVFAKEEVVADGVALLQLLRQEQATWMQATPVTWQLLLEAGWRGEPAVKVMCGGEAMTRQLAESLLACGLQVWNMYGPTETTVWSAALRVESGAGPVPIGPPIANTQFYILDRHGNLAPTGAPGELFIGGDGVALGYFGLPELTQEKFVPDRFRNLPDAKLYRTGDIVRLRASGSFEYLGRADHQVKLRGFRIELGEIEAVFLQHPDITEAVAVIGQDRSGQGAIWAYAVPRDFDAEPAEAVIEALRLRVAHSLPGYMRPASIVLLKGLPRTPNGKIDRRALPPPQPPTTEGKESILPGNETEQRLAKIWESVLGAEVVDTSADFFEMGGNSLLAARLMIGIETEFGKRLSLAALFQSPSIGQQAKLLEQSDSREFDFRQVVRMQPKGSKTPLIAIHNTGVYFYHLSKRLGPEQPLIALQLFDPSIPRQALPQSLEEIAAEYVQLIRQFQPSGPYALLGWCVGGVLAFEVARQLTHLNHEIKLLALIDSWAPGHLSRLSRLRAWLSEYSYRWKLIVADWRRVTSYQQSVTQFLAHRTAFKKILRALGFPVADAVAPVAFEDRNLNAESYDQWLLGYLDNVALGYIPKSYAGKITLLCSANEPRGLFLDPKMGWGAFSSQIDVMIIDGDHFTMFQGKGQKQMALHIAAAIDAQPNRRKSSDAVSA